MDQIGVRFERAVDATVTGDVATLLELLREDEELVRRYVEEIKSTL